MRVFVAGANGAVGRRLVPMLIANGHQVTGTTSSPRGVDAIRALGAEPVVMNGLDGVAVGEAVARAKPDAIIHEMTALSGSPDFRHFDRWFATTNRLRTEGTEHLLAAARASGVQRFVAQSFTGWSNSREGSWVKNEDDALDPHPLKAQTETLGAIKFLEQAVLAGPLDGIVVRYGGLYGPGSSETLADILRQRMFPVIGNGAGIISSVHVDDAAGGTFARASLFRCRECGRQCPGEVLLRMTAAGVCHSDEYFMSLPAEEYPFGLPLTLGQIWAAAGARRHSTTAPRALAAPRPLLPARPPISKR